MSTEEQTATGGAAAPGGGAGEEPLPPPGLDEVIEWVGAKVEEIGGASIGKIEGVYADADGGGPAWILLRVGRFGHRSLVPVAHAVEAGGKVWIPYERDHVRAAPRVEPGSELSREQELALCTHFEIPETAGRGAEVSPRPPSAITARPAAA